MDISKEYILMCEKTTEIQELWGYKEGDFFAHAGHTPPKILIVDDTENSYGDFDCACCEGKRTWLPRQDQLQDIIIEYWGEVDCSNSHVVVLDDFSEYVLNECPKETISMNSLEQLWLAFTMKEKYNKKWDGEEWI